MFIVVDINAKQNDTDVAAVMSEFIVVRANELVFKAFFSGLSIKCRLLIKV